MASVHCFTSATYSYLSRVRVLGNTLKRWNPDWSLTWVLPDEAPPGVVLDLSRVRLLKVPPCWLFLREEPKKCFILTPILLCSAICRS
jgi:hypothetical protein